MRIPSGSCRFCTSLALLIVAAAVCSAKARAEIAGADTTLAVSKVTFGPVRLGRNELSATVRNVGDRRVMAVLDLRAVPGMWMIPNWQRQFGLELAPGEEAVLKGTFEFRRLSREGTLRVRVGPGERTDQGHLRFRAVDFDTTYDVGADSPDAYDPTEDFTLTRRTPFEIYTWKGSLADRQIDAIAAARLRALHRIETLLAAPEPSRIRLVFYPDAQTKLEQTGHRGVGWALGSTLVEVYNDSVRLDPYHELAHVVAGEVGSPPPLLAEGFAIYATERLGGDALAFLGLPGRTVDEVVCGVAGSDDFIPLRDLLALDNIGSTAERAGREYAEAGSFVRYLVASAGWPRFRRAYAELDGDATSQENMEKLRTVYGLGVPATEGLAPRSVRKVTPRRGGAVRLPHRPALRGSFTGRPYIASNTHI